MPEHVWVIWLCALFIDHFLIHTHRHTNRITKQNISDVCHALSQTLVFFFLQARGKLSMMVTKHCPIAKNITQKWMRWYLWKAAIVVTVFWIMFSIQRKPKISASRKLMLKVREIMSLILQPNCKCNACVYPQECSRDRQITDTFEYLASVSWDLSISFYE